MLTQELNLGHYSGTKTEWTSTVSPLTPHTKCNINVKTRCGNEMMEKGEERPWSNQRKVNEKKENIIGLNVFFFKFTRVFEQGLC